MILNKIYILILLFVCVNHAQTYRDLDIYKGDSHTLSFEAPYDVSSDSLLFVVKADRDDDTPRVIALRNTAGGGSDSEIRVIYSAVSTILVKLTQINTEGLTAALYVYDLTIDSTTTLYTGTLKLRDEVGGSADGVATVTPYYTIVIDTPTYSPSFIIGQDSDNGWDVVSKSAFRDSLGFTVDSLDALRNFASVYCTGTLQVLGYYIAGDGGGGDFFWDAVSTATDDAGSIVKNDNVTTGRWTRIFNGADANVRWWGAKGDTTQDDTPYFLKAQTWAIANGKDFYIPYGNYKVSGGNSIADATKLQWSGGMRVYGNGFDRNPNQRLVTRIYPAADRDTIFAGGFPVGNQNRAMVVENLVFVGFHGTDTARVGVYGDWTEGAFRNVEWINFELDTIGNSVADYETDSMAVAVDMVGTDVLSFYNCIWNDNDISVKMMDSETFDTPNGWNFFGGRIIAINYYGIYARNALLLNLFGLDMSGEGSNVYHTIHIQHTKQLNIFGGYVELSAQNDTRWIYVAPYDSEHDVLGENYRLIDESSINIFGTTVSGITLDYTIEEASWQNFIMNITGATLVGDTKPILAPDSVKNRINLDGVLYHNGTAGNNQNVYNIKNYNSDDFTHSPPSGAYTQSYQIWEEFDFGSTGGFINGIPSQGGTSGHNATVANKISYRNRSNMLILPKKNIGGDSIRITITFAETQTLGTEAMVADIRILYSKQGTDHGQLMTYTASAFYDGDNAGTYDLVADSTKDVTTGAGSGWNPWLSHNIVSVDGGSFVFDLYATDATTLGNVTAELVYGANVASVVITTGDGNNGYD